jgi:hypothetical protein
MEELGNVDGQRRPLKKKLKVRIAAHTAISGKTLRARDEQFHTSTVIEKGTGFRGYAWAKDEEAGKELKRVCENAAFLALGRGKTRGQGLATMQLRYCA